MSNTISNTENYSSAQGINQTVFSKYEVCDRGFSEKGFWRTYTQIKQACEASRHLDGFDDYRKFIDRLRCMNDLQLVSLRDLMLPQNPQKKIIALRFDVDMEPLAAIRLARHNARYGIPSSFFLLHTAYYYGCMQGKLFYKNPLLKEWIKAFIISGCEIGLHTDALQVYLDHGVDGAAAVVEEIAWLRSQGAQIHGTAAHNSFPAYNAENFEIFKNYSLAGRPEAAINGKRFPLGVLTEEKLDLSYEANYPIPKRDSNNILVDSRLSKWCRSTNSDSVESERWMRTYLLDNPCFEKRYEAAVWHHGGDCWTIATKANRFLRSRWYWKVNGDRMFSVLKILPIGIRLVFLIHPIYFSRDTSQNQ